MIYSENEAAGVLLKVHESEVLLAQAHQEGSSDERIRSFARAISASHQSASLREAALFELHQVTPESTATSRLWALETGYDLSALREQRSPSIDRSYVDQKCFVYLRLRNLIDNALMPGARSEWLSSELLQVRGMAAAHMEEARALQEWLDAQEQSRRSQGWLQAPPGAEGEAR